MSGRFFGENSGGSFILKQRLSFKLSLMTASVRFYTHAGFIIAADGRQRWAHAPSRDEEVRAMESDAVQKIFKVSNDEMSLAYIAIGDIRSKDSSLDINYELREHIKSLSKERFASCYEYVSDISSRIEQNIRRLRNAGRLEGLPTTEIIFVGYFKGSPCVVTAQFNPHFNHIGSLYTVKSDKLWPGYCSVNGSLLIGELINSGDTRLLHYAKPIREEMQLEEAAEFAKGYIAACASPLASQIDLGYEHEKVGGHTHMATVTKEGGFQWLIRPKNKFISALKILFNVPTKSDAL